MRFVFVSPMRNASKTLAQMLHSLAGQSYPDWKVILVDDASDESEFERCHDIVSNFRLLHDRIHSMVGPVAPGLRQADERFTLVRNAARLWETQNVLNALSLCDSQDVCCRLDPDDYLCDLDALWHINNAYEQTGCDCLWTKHRWFDDTKHTMFNISGPLQINKDVYEQNWVSSHLKTFRRYLINDVPYENFTNMHGNLVQRAGDQAIYLPILHKAQKQVFLPFVTYAYRCDLNTTTFQTDDAKFQKAEADFIRKRGYVSSGITWEKLCQYDMHFC